MKIRWSIQSILGLALVLLAVVSLVIDIAGIVQIWISRDPITRDAINTLDLLNSTLDTSAQGLALAKTSLNSVTTTLGSLQTTVSGAAATISDASTSVNSLSTIVGTKLSGTINAALGTLDAVEATSKTIDQLLSGLASIPFLNLKYDPAKPLSASVGDLTTQLKDVPQSLSDLQKDLNSSGNSLEQVGADAKNLATSLGQVQGEISQLVAVIDQYEAQVKAFQGTVRNLRENIVTIVWGIVLFATFILVWIGVTMVQTLLRGLEMMGVRQRWSEPVDNVHNKSA